MNTNLCVWATLAPFKQNLGISYSLVYWLQMNKFLWFMNDRRYEIASNDSLLFFDLFPTLVYFRASNYQSSSFNLDFNEGHLDAFHANALCWYQKEHRVPSHRQRQGTVKQSERARKYPTVVHVTHWITYKFEMLVARPDRFGEYRWGS